LILNKTGETDSVYSKSNKRKTLLLIGDKMGAYQLAAQNDNVVYFYGFDDNFPEALEEMSIGKGSFTFVFYGGHRERWSRSITFTYNKQDNNWYLSKDEYGNIDVLDVEKEYPSHVLTSKNFGKVPFSRFNIYKATKYMDAYED